MQTIIGLWWLWFILSIPFLLAHYKLKNSGKSWGAEATTLTIGLLLAMMALVCLIKIIF